MLDTHPETGTWGTWTAAQCPFVIEYSRRALEEVRLSVVDAFFSVPRGGLEIGGVLLGKFESGRLSIADYRPIECEHALGPSFTLSAKDRSRLAEAIAAACKNTSNLQPVGWYHSHTRSEIFLSEADLEIHSRHFPEAWQVALVLRPSTFQPTRGGFFFREADGTIHATDTYEEFVIEPLPVHQAHPMPSIAAAPLRAVSTLPIESNVAVEKPAESVAVPEARIEPPPRTEPAAETESPTEPWEIPAFLQVQPARSRRWLWIGALAVLIATGGVAAYQEREMWLPQVLAATTRDASPQPHAPPPAQVTIPIALTITGNQGPLQIGWDPHSAEVERAESAVLEITDAGQTTEIPLDPRHLQAGAFTYLRRSDRVDAKLSIVEPGGRHAQATASFFGTLPAATESTEPEPKPGSEADTLRRQNAELRKRNAKLKSDLDAATERVRELQRQQLLLLERQQ
jgi:proteasome lid subunit RPN8/RPN11